ncbi:MAG: hypothetical protein JWP87_3067 [Labilithrix sp.]|nr:hypothetical protein [Labilithrix sp.]
MRPIGAATAASVASVSARKTAVKVPFSKLLAAGRGRKPTNDIGLQKKHDVHLDGGRARMDGGGSGGVRVSERGSEGEREGGSGSDGGGEREGASERARGGESPVDWLDPAARHVAQLAPPVGIVAESIDARATEAVRGRSLEELLPVLVKRIAWAGDRNKGTVRLELGAGAYAGTTVVVHADGARVRVELAGSEGPELDRLRARLDARLRGHGLDVESVT